MQHDRSSIIKRYILKFVLVFILLFVIAAVILMILRPHDVASKNVHENNFKKGVVLDIARKDYTKQSIKAIIRDVAQHNGHYVQLHFSDNENYAIESQYLKNHKYNLSKRDVKELAIYANDKNVMLVPDFDIPGHSRYFINHVKTSQMIKTNYDDDVIDFYNSKAATTVTDRQIKEIAHLFKQPDIKNQRFHIGADEISGSHSHQKDLIQFINHKQNLLKDLNYQASIWNDSITTKGLHQLNKNIIIFYWQQNGAASAQKISDAGFELYNCNLYSLAFMPHARVMKNTLKEQSQYMSKRRLNEFNEDHNVYRQRDIKTSGVAYTYWSEKAHHTSQRNLLTQIKHLNNTFFDMK